MTVTPLGDSAVLLAFGETVDSIVLAKVRAAAERIERYPPSGVVDVVPAFATIAVFFEPTHPIDFESRRMELEALVAQSWDEAVPVVRHTIEIPVCYGGALGPDIEEVAQHTKLSATAVIALHAGAQYQVHAIGFAPGFPYLGGLPSSLAAPRRSTPRPRVPAGSVGIGGAQTGVYSLETPGGWNLIGRTPLTLFDPKRPVPALLRAGDQVTFRAISESDFEAAMKSQSTPSGAAGEGNGAMLGAASRGNDPASVPGIEVVRAGMLTIIQDLGRPGHRARGVPLSGGADTFAVRLTNLLVGNPEGAAVLEFTLVGPELKFLHDTLIALGGGEFGDLPRWRPLSIRAGTTVKVAPSRSGCRGYLAVAGGILVPPVLGSRSTYLRGGFGGWRGRPLHEGDLLPILPVHVAVRDHWRIDERILPRYCSSPIVRVVRGQNASEFDDAWRGASFKVSTQSDRMGVRLSGEPLVRSVARELVSFPVAPGTIQVPPDGQPIVLLADAQTIGGYPQVAHVATVDLPLMAQLRPGDTVRFRQVTLDEAREVMAAQERALGLLREGLAEKLA